MILATIAFINILSYRGVYFNRYERRSRFLILTNANRVPYTVSASACVSFLIFSIKYILVAIFYNLRVLLSSLYNN